MKYHLQDYWPIYAIVTLFIAAILVLAASAQAYTAKRAACMAQGEVLVEYESLTYCASPLALRGIK